MPDRSSTEPESNAPAPDPSLAELRVGELIAGRFRLEQVLGRGGMGVVWEAVDESLGLKHRALKFLHETFARDPVSVAELKEEVVRCQELTHRHIIRVHDLVEDRSRGLVAVSMEVAAGGCINKVRAQRPHRWFEPEELRDWVGQLCAALEYAHGEARIIHRDLKPANLLLDERGNLKVADFGIAKALSESVTRLTGATGGPTSGTPAYMSPEQARGKTPKSSDDIYSLGATLYDLLTGKPPYLGTPHSVLISQLLDAGTVPPPMVERRRELRGVVAPVPREWEEVIAACLAKDPEERPKNAAEVFARLLGGQHFFAAPRSGGEEMEVNSVSEELSSARSTAIANDHESGDRSSLPRAHSATSAHPLSTRPGCSLTLTLSLCAMILGVMCYYYFANNEDRSSYGRLHRLGKVDPSGPWPMGTPAPVPRATPISASPRPQSPIFEPPGPRLVGVPTPHPSESSTPEPPSRSTPPNRFIGSGWQSAHSTVGEWKLYKPGTQPAGRTITVGEAVLLDDKSPKEVLYLSGKFFVSAAGGNKAILRPTTLDAGNTRVPVRVIAEYPDAALVPNENERVERDATRAFHILEVKKTEDGTVNLQVREITKE
jgi:serine/threonine protein kinase